MVDLRKLLLLQWLPKLKSLSKELTALLKIERAVRRQGFKFVAGVDEVGRGCLAGPVVAAACIVPKGVLIPGVNDSKKLTPEMREQLFPLLTSKTHFSIGIIDHQKIDEVNIYQASILAMLEAIQNLTPTPDHLLVDGMDLKTLIPCQKIIGGDAKSYCIAAASIIAKVTRDRMMCVYHEQWPEYGFNQHKGYATAQHTKAIEKHGPCPIHRMTFAPLKSRA